MKKAPTTQYIIFAVTILAILALYTILQAKPKDIAEAGTGDSDYPSLPAEELFVPIQVDTLDLYLKKYFNKGGLKTRKQRNKFTVEYNPNALILLHANNNKMPKARQILESAEVDGFSIDYQNGKVRITMPAQDKYVSCPSLILAEILRKQNES